MIILNQTQHEQLERFNIRWAKMNRKADRRLSTVPLSDGTFALQEDVLSDDYWRHWHPFLRQLPRRVVPRNQMILGRLEDGLNNARRLVMHPEMERIKQRLRDNPEP